MPPLPSCSSTNIYNLVRVLAACQAGRKWHSPLESNQASRFWRPTRQPWNIGLRYKSYSFIKKCQGFVRKSNHYFLQKLPSKSGKSYLLSMSCNDKNGYGGRTRTYNYQIQILGIYLFIYTVSIFPII